MKGCILPGTLCCVLTMSAVEAYSSQDVQALINKMLQHENKVHLMYLEYQKLYYEDKSRRHELAAFEDLLTVYIDQVMEIYETLNLSLKKTGAPRDVAARTLVFKSLMYLEKAPLNVEYYERACYEYYEALSLYEGAQEAPVIYKDLTQIIKAGAKTYFRLIDILEDKGGGLRSFGKVSLTFRNFMVTANFNPARLQLTRIDESMTFKDHTFVLAEERIKSAFAEVFRTSSEVQTYVALPAGTYLLRLLDEKNTPLTALTRFYVRPSQEQNYIMEPLADWIILYEKPTSRRPDYHKFRRSRADISALGFSDNLSTETNGNGTVKSAENKEGKQKRHAENEKLVGEIVADLLPQFEIKLMFDLNNPEIRDNAIEIIARAIVEYVESKEFYSDWNHWTASWNIAKNVRQVISPGSLIPVELIELINGVINEL